jgi:hypothetical protein
LESSSTPLFGHTDAVLEIEGLGHHRNGQDAHFLGDLGHHRRRTGTRTTAHAGRDEAHVGTFEGRGDRIAGLLGRSAAGFRLGAGTQTGLAELDLGLGQTAGQRLGIGVGDDEIHPLHTFADHVIDGVATRATHTNHLDVGATARLFNNFKHLPRLQEKLRYLPGAQMDLYIVLTVNSITK